MNKHFLILGQILALTAFAQAPDDVPLTFARLDLLDGRALKNVVVKSYDAASGKLLVLASGKAMTIPIAVVPPPFNEQLKRAPASGSSVSTSSTPPRPIVTAANQYQLSTPVPVTVAPTVVPNLNQIEPAPPPQRRKAGPPRATAAQHAAAAQSRAQNYFRYEFQIGSNSISVTALNFELEPPKAVPGWDGRYETEGKAYIEWYDSVGRSFQRTTSTFEVVTEQKLGEPLKVIDFRRKS